MGWHGNGMRLEDKGTRNRPDYVVERRIGNPAWISKNVEAEGHEWVTRKIGD
jgi:hypothetical protein